MRRIFSGLGLLAALYANPAGAEKSKLPLSAEPLSVKHDCYATPSNYIVCGVNVAVRAGGEKDPISVRIDTKGSLEKTLELANLIQLEIDDQDRQEIPFWGDYVNDLTFRAAKVAVKGRMYKF